MAQIKPFSFKGSISASKSLMNRALVVQSFFPDLKLHGESICDDVTHMKKALMQFQFSETMDCGAAGTTFRFLMGRVSREMGEYFLTGEPRLLERPHQELIRILSDLGARVQLEEKAYLKVNACGWDLSSPIKVSLSQSSQYASALLLSAWVLPQDLILQLGEDQKSFSYLKMTIDFLGRLGMLIQHEGNRLVVPAEQKVKVSEVFIEPDMSSCFAVSAFAGALGEAVITNFPKESLQPDHNFLNVLNMMDIPYSWAPEGLSVSKQENIKPISVDLNDNPDLFPVLAVLLLGADGVSEVTGIDHLVYKESNRIKKTEELLKMVGGSCSYQNKKFLIQGRRNHKFNENLSFDPDQDHRMAMAAALLNAKGASINILNKEVVNKSFPEFWSVVGDL